ncbi:glycosyltransferase [Phreatobacter stygius]|uniref:Glycosyltransferase n=1 Tax=Phreatobacter stygius TaxID=1940610 RepID=A0A4D7B786_9HYPH|nr:glycosyltransferase [Phreatobacter stygius]QCI66230.1 glycosyltransferase [Phreatobacter stygius]
MDSLNIPDSMISGTVDALPERRGAGPVIAVVIPVFKHSVFLAEAVQSIQAQQADFPIVTIIVDDGCPFVETAVMGSSLAMAYDNVVYLRKVNGGLSSARNHGIDHALTHFPSLRAIYFLDADNRVSPTTLASCLALLDPDNGVGWIYPNVDKFGAEWNGNYTGSYSKLVHCLFDNICEAGSLVSRAVFDAGVRYDEGMKQGCEDWEFWLQCLDHGFTGLNNPHFGFEYRMRGESMVSDTARDISGIKQYMFKKHPGLFSTSALMTLEHQESPRFLCISPPTDQAAAFTDPTVDHPVMSHDLAIASLYRGLFEPDSYGTPQTVIWLRKELLDALKRTSLVWTLFHNIEKALPQANFLCLRFVSSPDEISIEFKEIGEAHEMPRRVHGWACSQAILKQCVTDPSRDWVGSLSERRPSPTVIEMTVRVPIAEQFLAKYFLPLPLAVLATIEVADDLGLSLADQPRWSWREAYYPTVKERPALIEAHLGAESLLPMIRSADRPQVGIALPIAAYGGVERVAFAVAKVLKDWGCDVHLYCFGKPNVKTYKGQASVFKSINFFNEPGYNLWGGSRPFMGHELRMEWDDAARAKKVLGFLGSLDVLINCQVAPLNAILGTIRRRGVKTVSHVHVIDQTYFGRSVGHPYLTLGFEHAHDMILTCSQALKDWFHGMGVPDEKVIHIPNAGAYTPPDYKAQSELARRRRALKPDRPVKALFAGRLDAQKGVERLLALAKAGQERGLAISWRLIGSELINANGRQRWKSAFSALGIAVEDPIYDPQKLCDVYRDADMLIMTSRWEGAPLAIIEAQRFGCIPVATDVGAVAELIDDGVDGFVIPDGPDETVVEAFLERVGGLAGDPGRLAPMAERAIARASEAEWTKSCAPFLAQMDKWFPKARP